MTSEVKHRAPSTPQPEASIAARYFACLIDHLEAQGLPCQDVLSAAQLAALDDRQARLTVGQASALLATLQRVCGRDDLGFELGRRLKLNSHGMLGFAILSCSSVDQMMRLLVRFYSLNNTLFTLSYRRNGTQCEVLFEPTCALPEGLRQFCIEALAAAFHTQMGMATEGKLTPYDIYLPIPAPAHHARYRELKTARLHFGAESSAVRVLLDAALFDLPASMAEPRARREAEAQCKQQLRELSSPRTSTAWAAAKLHEAEDCQPRLNDLARMLNMSVRTLDRKLENEGVRFRSLAVSVRNERARSLLASGKYPVSEVAIRLGYSDTANFSRSFKRANGVSPSTYIAQLA